MSEQKKRTPEEPKVEKCLRCGHLAIEIEEDKHLPRRGVARTPTRRMNVERGHTLVCTPSDLGWTPLR